MMEPNQLKYDLFYIPQKRVAMGNRRIEVYEYKQVIYRLRKGQSTRSIAKDGLMSRDKVRKIQSVAREQG